MSFKNIIYLLTCMFQLSSCGNSCIECDEPENENSQYCIYHSCEECGELKDIDDKWRSM